MKPAHQQCDGSAPVGSTPFRPFPHSPVLSGRGCRGLVRLGVQRSAGGGAGAVAWRDGGQGRGAATERRGSIPAGAGALQGSQQAETAFPEDLNNEEMSVRIVVFCIVLLFY